MDLSQIATSQTNNGEQESTEAEVTTSATEQESTEAEVTTSAEGEGTKGTEGADKSDSSIEAYADFDLPDGVELDSALLEEATPLFKELGLSQEQAQKLVDFQAKQAQASQQGQQDAFNQLKLDWLEQAKNDKQLGGDKFDENIAVAKDALSKFGNEGLTKLLNDFGIGNHPEVIRFMVNVGKLTKEDNPDSQGSIGNRPLDRVSVLYPEN